MTSPYADDLALALELADIADGITMARYRAADLAVETKPDLTPVSESDKAAELALRERLAAARPDDAVIGEEFGGAEDFDPARPGAGRAWVIDPIDGTKSYVRGMDTWTTLIALLDGRRGQGRRRRDAGAGQALVGGARAGRVRRRPADPRVQGRRCSAARSSSGAGSRSGTRSAAFERVVDLGRRCWRTRGVGDAWQYMLVAEGAAEIATDPEATLWDLAAVSIVVEEAGGRFTSLGGVEGPGCRQRPCDQRPVARRGARRARAARRVRPRARNRALPRTPPTACFQAVLGPPLSWVGVSRASVRCA